MNAWAPLVLPYAVWMALMMLLPSEPWAYAVRTAVAGVALLLSALRLRRLPAAGPSFGLMPALWGVGAGLLVFVLWVFPERWEFYCRWFVIGGVEASASSVACDPVACGWPLALVRLAGSAFVISAAEELFFRSFLYRWLLSRDWEKADPRRFDLSAFLWMVGLFALEHNRWLAAVLAGSVYGFLYMRKGLGAAILAHAVTNLVLGIYVLRTGLWQFW